MAKIEEEAMKCGSCGGPGLEPHTCPFAEEIRDDHETKCNCCAACSHECAMDV